MYCKYCGAEIKIGSKYCTKCGKECVESATSQGAGNTFSGFGSEKESAKKNLTVDNKLKNDFSFNFGDFLKKKKIWFILVAGMVIAFFIAINVLIYMSRQGLFFIKKDLPDGTVEKYKMVSLSERVLFSTIEKNENDTIETIYGESGEIEKKIVEHSSGTRDELYYYDGLEYLKKYYSLDEKVSKVLFRITPKINEEEDTSYDFILESVPAIIYPVIDMTDYDKEQEWEEFVFDEEGNIVKYLPLSENADDYYQYEYYTPGKLKALYRYDGRNFTQAMRYYESGAIFEEEQYNSRGKMLSACEYNENGEVLKTTEITWESDYDGFGTICYADGTTEEVTYKGTKISSCYTYDANGKIIKEWIDHDNEIEETEYYPDLEVEKSTIFYDKNGNVVEKAGEGTLEEIENDEKKWSWYDANENLLTEKIFDNLGNIKSEYSYDDGILYREENFDTSGNIKSRIVYYSDGSVSSESVYNGNVEQSKYYYSNGVLEREEVEEKDGTSKYTYYREDGTLKEYIEQASGRKNKRIQYESDGSYLVETFKPGTSDFDERIQYNADGTIKEREIYKYAEEGDFQALPNWYTEINRSVLCHSNYVDHKKGMIDYHYDGEGNLFLIETHENTSVNKFIGNIHRAYVP